MQDFYFRSQIHVLKFFFVVNTQLFSIPCEQSLVLEPVLSLQSSHAFAASLKEKVVIFGERLVSTWQLHKHHLCLPFAPHQLHQTRQSTRTQTQTLLRCSLNSAAPLTLSTYTSCTQTFHGVNTQRSALNTK